MAGKLGFEPKSFRLTVGTPHLAGHANVRIGQNAVHTDMVRPASRPNMVGREGFEPSIIGLKVRGLCALKLPSRMFLYTYVYVW